MFFSGVGGIALEGRGKRAEVGKVEEGVEGVSVARFGVPGRVPGSLAAAAGVGMRSSELLAVPGKKTKGGGRPGPWEGKLGREAQVGGLLSSFSFLLCFLLLFVMVLLNKIANHFIKC